MLHVPELETLARKGYMETRRGAWSGFFTREDGSTLYVNRGLGRFKRISFYCPPELTVWELLPYETALRS
jgi:predicted MPP superfamily phosphohydrolase